MHQQVALGDGVQLLVVVQHKEGCHQHLNGYGGFQQEGLVADQLYIGCQQVEPLQQALGIALLAYQDGKVLRGEACLHKAADLGYHIRYHAFLVILRCRVAALGIESYGGIALVLCLESQLLYVAIDVL